MANLEQERCQGNSACAQACQPKAVQQHEKSEIVCEFTKIELIESNNYNYKYIYVGRWTLVDQSAGMLDSRSPAGMLDSRRLEGMLDSRRPTGMLDFRRPDRILRLVLPNRHIRGTCFGVCTIALKCV